MNTYRTVSKEASAEQTIERSRFIAYVSPAQTREEALVFVDRIRRKHKEATHNVPAMVIGDKFQIQWASDDGEPQGTSGAPMVRMLVEEGITNVVIVVTRYFGGIKLGTGGLVRAYTSSAKLGLESAGVREVRERNFITVRVEYNQVEMLKKSIENVIQRGQNDQVVEVYDIRYTDKVEMDIWINLELREELEKVIGNGTLGRGIYLRDEVRYA